MTAAYVADELMGKGITHARARMHAHTHAQTLFGYKRNTEEILPFATAWMKFESIVPSETNHSTGECEVGRSTT